MKHLALVCALACGSAHSERKLMQQALDAGCNCTPEGYAAMNALRERLAHCDRCGKKLGGPDHIHTCSPQQPVQEHAGCARSHPHEGMSLECELRTEIARLTNENARLKAQQPVQEPYRWVREDQFGCPHFVDENAVGSFPLYTTPQPAQEPVSGVVIREGLPTLLLGSDIKSSDQRLCTAPQPRQRQWLTRKEEEEIKDRCTTVACVLKAVKAKLREKNGGKHD